MFRYFSETLREPTIANVIILCHELGIKVSKTKIRKLFFERFKDSKTIPATDLQEILLVLGISTFIAKVSLSKAKEMVPPYFLLMEPEDMNFSLILDHNDQEMILYETNACSVYQKNTTLIEGTRSYLGIFIDFYNKNTCDEDYQSDIISEQNAAKEYKESINIIPNLFSPKECEDVINFCESEQLFEKSKVFKLDRNDNEWIGYSNVCTSSTAALISYKKIEEILDKQRQIASTESKLTEHPVCIRYQTGEEFRQHHKASDGDNRVNTIIVFLNDNIAGGEIFFPEINYTVKPERGTCLVFPNLDNNLFRIAESVHCVLPVTSGNMYTLESFEVR
ncbi:prolyl hydroxylase family protein [Filimonas effusa]|uniref:2OG-Fe(II) oxygenase n=1 Tax=Filimonas effusa TaxID=2508721 RepID=A0A4V1MAH1_9BACT|nr:2OG-Fe(II) oxygenase [Filimonas effusa]RXK85856.1 2OG-Fe(II) oxygenase [Filimonas effusa]